MRSSRWLMIGLLSLLATAGGQEPKKMTQRELVQATLDATQPLDHPRGSRLPLYLWQLNGLGTEDAAEMRDLLRQLDARGLAATANWNPSQVEKSLASALALSRAQHELGLDVNINAVRCLYSFFNGDEQTAHITAEAERFFDFSHQEKKPIGCPYAVQYRYPVIREQVDVFLRAYAAAGIPVDFIFGDWEVDGPLEWNGGWEHAKRCVRCRENVPEIENFRSYQDEVHRLRAEMQRECFAEPVLAHFPAARVGNYAVYPNDGWRHWYDYFEVAPSPPLPFALDQRSPVRPWSDEWSRTGYTFAMPVAYTWYRTWDWYDYPNGDYRWFYNMLQVGSNAARSTPPATPLITFVHWHTTAPPPEPDPAVRQMSAAAYQELLWHLLLRGHDALFLWSPRDEAIEESRLLHEVYAASLEYERFLSAGTPVTNAVPREQGPVVSGLRLGNELLVRRTDFDDGTDPVELVIDGQTIAVPRAAGCQLLTLR